MGGQSDFSKLVTIDVPKKTVDVPIRPPNQWMSQFVGKLDWLTN